MNRFNWIRVLGAASIAAVAFAACSRDGQREEARDMTSSMQELRGAAASVQTGLSAWDKGDTREGVVWIGRGTDAMQEAVSRMGSGLETLRESGRADTCVVLVDQGQKRVGTSFEDVRKGYDLLTDDSPWNDDQGIDRVRTGLSGITEQFASLDSGVKGLAPAVDRSMMASGAVTQDPCAGQR